MTTFQDTPPVSGPASRRQAIGRRRFVTAAGAALLPTFTAHSARAADFPARPLRLIIFTAPGGQSGVVGQAIADELAEVLGQPVILDFKPGASGQIATSAAAKAVGDPYTLLLSAMGIMSISPHLYPNLPYDVLRDFTPLALCGKVAQVMVVNPNVVPVRTLREFIAWAKAQKAPPTYGSYGSGSLAHIAAVTLEKAAGLQMTQVPYRSAPNALTDMMNGGISVIVDLIGTYQGLIEQGRLRAIAVTSRERSPLLPTVPTMAESGLPGLDVDNWYGMYAPRDLPPGVEARLREAMAKALQSPRLREKLKPIGMEIAQNGADDFAGYHKREWGRWQAFIERHGIKADKV